MKVNEPERQKQGKIYGIGSRRSKQLWLYSVLFNNGDSFIPLESPAEGGIILAFAVPVGDGVGGGGRVQE